MKPTAREQYMKLIDEVDLLLVCVYDLWANSKTRAERTKHHDQLDMLLDERLTIMKSRDKSL